MNAQSSDSSSAPDVSILIPCYNAEKWVGAAIESALAQTGPATCEVIVVDDGSSDGSVEVIRSFGDRIRWETGPNRGGNPARNRLLELSRGTWLQYLDADDCLEPGKVAGQLEVLRRHPEVDVVFGPSIYEWHRPDGRVEREVLPIPEPHDPWILLVRWFLPQTGSPLWRKDAIVRVGGWKPDQPCCQEHELYLRLLCGGARFRYDDASGSVYRQWSEQTVCKKDKPLVRTKRMEITDRAHDWLLQHDALTPERLYAINMGRFETARSSHAIDPAGAMALVRRILQSDPRFVPSGRAAPKSYQLAWRILGFAAAERIAALSRRLK